MIKIEGQDSFEHSELDDITLCTLSDGGDKLADAELAKRHPEIFNPTKTFDVGVEANLVQGDYSQRVVVKAARGDGYYQVENVSTGKTGWVASTDLE